MALIAVLTRDVAVRDAARGLLGPHQEVASARSWERCVWLARERPVTGVVIDTAGLDPGQEPADAVAELSRRYPSLGTVMVHRPQLDPWSLYRLGQVRFDGLALVVAQDVTRELRAALSQALKRSAVAQVLRAVSPALPRWETRALRLALDGVQLGWGADDLAAELGLSRPHLSVRLRAVGLPSPGHLLLWAKLLHAARWLEDPGRSAESIARQLEYCDGAAFRRAVRNYLDATPTAVRERGGLRPVLELFLDVCGVGDSVGVGRSVA